MSRRVSCITKAATIGVCLPPLEPRPREAKELPGRGGTDPVWRLASARLVAAGLLLTTLT
jgi:hypothetical protein